VRSADAEGDDFVLTLMPLNEPGALVRHVDDNTRNVRDWQPISITSGDWLMLFARRTEPIELYRLNGRGPLGPNVAAEHPEVVEHLHAKLIAELARAGADERAIEARA
jgi:hypothetical protein